MKDWESSENTLEDQIEKILIIMPPKISEVFHMDRYEGIKYSKIAGKLNVSQRTVEVRIGKALHLLRELLKDYLH